MRDNGSPRARFPLSSDQLELLLAFEAARSPAHLVEIVRRDGSVVSRNLQRLAETFRHCMRPTDLSISTPGCCVQIPFATTFGGLFERAETQKHKEPFDMPKRWLDGKLGRGKAKLN